MYRSQLWTMRMFAGFGTARRHQRAVQGAAAGGRHGPVDRVRHADADGPRLGPSRGRVGEVGRAGVAIDTLADMEDLFADIDLATVTTSMTINGPAAIVMAMYIAVGRASAASRARRWAGTIQNDILKEYQAQKEYIFPPRPSMRLVTDMMRFTTAEMPRWHPSRSPATTSARPARPPRRSWRSRWRTASPTSKPRVAAGLDVDDFAPRLSFFFNSHIDFFEEIGKFRAARRIWARWMRERYGAKRRALAAAALPHADRGRVAHRAAAGDQHRPRRVAGAGRGARRDAELAHRQLRRGAGAAHREGGAHRACAPSRSSPTRPASRTWPTRSGGSPYVEWMTDEMERQAEEVFAHLLELGDGSMLEGVYAGIESGYFQGEIADAAYRFERQVNAGRRIIVGVNAFTEGDEDGRRHALHRPRRSRSCQLQAARRRSSSDRDSQAVHDALDRVDATPPTRRRT